MSLKKSRAALITLIEANENEKLLAALVQLFEAVNGEAEEPDADAGDEPEVDADAGDEDVVTGGEIDWSALSKKQLKKIAKAAKVKGLDLDDEDAVLSAVQSLDTDDLDAAAETAEVKLTYIEAEAEAETSTDEEEVVETKKPKKDKKKDK